MLTTCLETIITFGSLLLFLLQNCLLQTSYEQVRSPTMSSSPAQASQSTRQVCYQDIRLKSSTISKWQLLSLQPSQRQTSAIWQDIRWAAVSPPTTHQSWIGVRPTHLRPWASIWTEPQAAQVTFKPWTTPKYITWTVGEHDIEINKHHAIKCICSAETYI